MTLQMVDLRLKLPLSTDWFQIFTRSVEDHGKVVDIDLYQRMLRLVRKVLILSR